MTDVGLTTFAVFNVSQVVICVMVSRSGYTMGTGKYAQTYRYTAVVVACIRFTDIAILGSA